MARRYALAYVPRQSEAHRPSPYDTSKVDGALKWAYATGGAVQSSPAIGSNGTIYVGSDDHKLYAIGTTETTAPSAPQNLQASADDGQVTLSWSPPADDGGSPITKYKIYRGVTSVDSPVSVGQYPTEPAYVAGASGNKGMRWNRIAGGAGYNSGNSGNHKVSGTYSISESS